MCTSSPSIPELPAPRAAARAPSAAARPPGANGPRGRRTVVNPNPDMIRRAMTANLGGSSVVLGG